MQQTKSAIYPQQTGRNLKGIGEYVSKDRSSYERMTGDPTQGYFSSDMHEELGAQNQHGQHQFASQRFKSPTRAKNSTSNSPRPQQIEIKRPSKVETWLYKSEQKKIHEENMHFLHKLMKQKSQFSKDQWQVKREKEESMLKNICRFPHIFSQQQVNSKTPSMKEKRILEFQRINYEMMRKKDALKEIQMMESSVEGGGYSALGIQQHLQKSMRKIEKIGELRERKASLKQPEFKNTSLLQISTNDSTYDIHSGEDAYQMNQFDPIQQQTPLFHHYQVKKAQLKPFDLGDTYGIPLDRKVLFRRLLFTPAYHKVLIELSKKNQKFYIVVKKYKNDKFKYHIHEMYCVQAKKLLQMFENDYQTMIDACIVINTKKGVKPVVDFSRIDRCLKAHMNQGAEIRITPRQQIEENRIIGLHPQIQKKGRNHINVGESKSLGEDIIQEETTDEYWMQLTGENQQQRFSAMTVHKKDKGDYY